MIGSALRKLLVAAAIVLVVGLLLNNLVRVSQPGQAESRGYVSFYFDEHGTLDGLARGAAAVSIIWLPLLFFVRRADDARSASTRAQVARPAEVLPGMIESTVLPEWLEEKATKAPTMFRVVMEAIDRRLQREHPQVLSEPAWSQFSHMGTVGGCAALAMRLHVEVPEPCRTPVELRMRASLELGFPESEALYEDCTQFVRDGLLDVDRPKRFAACWVLLSIWVFGTVGDGDSLIVDATLVAKLAEIY